MTDLQKIASESSSARLKRKKRFHFALLVFFGGMLLTFALWGAYLQGMSAIEQNVMSNIMLLMGSLFSGAVGLFVWSLETRDEYLQREVFKRTAELEHKNKELSIKNQEIENFIYIISHDLKAPLVSIQGFASIAQSEASAISASSKDAIDRIISNSKRMSMLLRDLLEFSRVGRMEDDKEDVNMTQLVKDILQELSPEIQKKKAQVKCDSELPMLWGAKKRLYQVFANLIGNAIKYSSSKTAPVISIETRASDNGFHELCVTDNGIGIPKESQGKVFQIFQRFHPDLSIEGTGVGLSIVKKIVVLNGGAVRCESEVGRGTSFYVKWPMKDHSES